MPTPIEILLDPLSLVVLTMYAFVLIWEAVFPARKLPDMKNWKLKGVISFFIFFYLSSYLPMWVDPLLEPLRIIDLSSLGVLEATVIGILFYELFLYLWHYAMHRSDLLWRVFHQMHHSAERMDAIGAFYFSPMDMIGFTMLGSLCFAFAIGLPAQSISLIILITTFLSMFQHANIKTPVWLGYIIQRPESHTVHHAKGVHKYNYSDIAIFDILFGTFNNPASYEYETGFYEGASNRILEMLQFKNVNKRA